jgi:hypothetical protein
MPKNADRDWVGFWVHFVFGAILGAVIGLWVWGRPVFRLYDSSLAGFLCIGGGALLGGLLAGFGRDSFWESFRR